MGDLGFRRHDPPDEIEIELLGIGALDGDPERRAAAERAARGELSGLAEELDRSRADWARAPALPSIARAPAPANTTRWYGVLFVLAAAVLLAVLAWRPPADDGIRAMGGLPVDLVVLRGGATLPAAGPLGEGDLLDLAMVVPRAGTVYVGTVQDDGQVTVLYRSAEPLRAGQRFELPGALELDDYAGREWLVVGMTSGAPEEGLLVQALGDMLPEPTAAASSTIWIHEVTRGR